MLQLNKLEIFMIAAKHGNFSKAAEQLYLSQPAVSQHIQELEETLGTKLFNRSRRGVTLTKAGDTLLHYAQKIFDLIAEAENAIINITNLVNGTITIGATPGINVYLLPEWIQIFQQQYPHLTVSLQSGTTDNIIQNTQQGLIDIGIIEGEISDQIKGLGICILQHIELFVIVGKWHKCWDRSVAPASALNGQPFIVRQQGSQTRQWFEKILSAHEITPHVVAEFDNPESIKHAVISGMGITILPEYAIKQEVEMGILKAIPIENIPLRRTLKLIWNKTRPLNPINRAFLFTLAQIFPHIKHLIQF